MTTVITQQGKTIEVISQTELWSPFVSGEHVRAYCHIHGSDHQRSLSINRATGWGHCFNATCQAVVLVAEWNPEVASHLLQYDIQASSPFHPSTPSHKPQRQPLAYQPPLFREQPETPVWQQKELGTLVALEKRMNCALARSRLARTYLRERKLSVELALSTGVCFLPPKVQLQSTLRRWAGRIIFPLVTPMSQGYIGRTLCGWRSGMDENYHKALLDQRNRARRWLKTNPAGWFSSNLDQLARSILVVEGAFDRLTLLSAGFASNEVVALTGTAMQPDWLPPQVKEVILALDGDEGGKEASYRIADLLARDGIAVNLCLPPQDRWGKDWNERWRHIGREAVEPLIELAAPPPRTLKLSS
ncbi:MAG TPA: toprim domain-containing protein [Ktedonobacteraceae bacterium]|nr:toprim domain-containing protein [Ktedonobacteraceae bacterium]